MKTDKDSLGVIDVKLIGGPLDGHVRGVPVQYFLERRSLISFSDFPEPKRFVAHGRAPCRMAQIKQHDYRVHYNGTHVSLRYEA